MKTKPSRKPSRPAAAVAVTPAESAQAQPKRVKLTRDELEAKRKREGELLFELTNEHDYTLIEMAREADRHAVQMSAGKISTARVVKLAIPLDSMLCRELDKLDKARTKTLATSLKRSR